MITDAMFNELLNEYINNDNSFMEFESEFESDVNEVLDNTIPQGFYENESLWINDSLDAILTKIKFETNLRHQYLMENVKWGFNLFIEQVGEYDSMHYRDSQPNDIRARQLFYKRMVKEEIQNKAAKEGARLFD